MNTYNSKHKKVLYKCKLHKIDLRSNAFMLTRLSSKQINSLLSVSKDRDKFISSLLGLGLLSYTPVSLESIKERSKIRQSFFRSKRKQDYSATQIYIEKELKQKFKESCLRDNISMQDKINQLIKDYLY